MPLGRALAIGHTKVYPGAQVTTKGPLRRFLWPSVACVRYLKGAIIGVFRNGQISNH